VAIIKFMLPNGTRVTNL